MGTRIAKGIYKDAYRYDVRATANQITRFLSFPLDTPVKKMKAWQEDQRATIRRTHPVPTKGTLAADIVTYLARPDIKKLASYRQIEVMLAYWSDRLGHKRRQNITADDIRQGLDALPATAGAATKEKHRAFLIALWKALDGPSAGCPAKDVPRPKKGKNPVRSIKPEVFQAILDHIPHGSVLEARVLVIAHTGLPPGMLASLTPDAIDFLRGTVTVPPRQKGAGVEGRVLPLSDAAKAAFRLWIESGGYRPVTTDAISRGFHEAAVAAGYRGVRLYDLRHTFLTRVAQHAGIQAAMGLGLHANIGTTQRYANGAVNPLMQSAVDSLNLAEASSSQGGSPTNQVH